MKRGEGKKKKSWGLPCLANHAGVHPPRWLLDSTCTFYLSLFSTCLYFYLFKKNSITLENNEMRRIELQVKVDITLKLSFAEMKNSNNEKLLMWGWYGLNHPLGFEVRAEPKVKQNGQYRELAPLVL